MAYPIDVLELEQKRIESRLENDRDYLTSNEERNELLKESIRRTEKVLEEISDAILRLSDVDS